MQGKLHAFVVESYLREDGSLFKKVVERAIIEKNLPYVLWNDAKVHVMLENNLIESPYMSHL